MHDITGGSPHCRFTNVQQATNPHILDVIPDEVGPRVTTFRGGAIHSIRPPGSQTFFSEHYFAAVMLAPSPGISAAYADDKPNTYDAPLGMIAINPPNLESHLEWKAARENMVVAISREQMAALGEQEFDIGAVELEPVPFGTVDLSALRLAEMLKLELQRGEAANQLMVDSLITLFGLHLLRSYNKARGRVVRARGGLSDFSTRRIREYLEENFTRKLTVGDLASICNLSPGHFLQAFTKTFGEPPHRYLLNLRLDFAEKLLLEPEITIAEVAYLCGFSSQSHLTSTMKRYRNVTPAQIKSAGR